MATTIATPRVLVYQQVTPTAAPRFEPLRACIVGPNARLHRHAVADEKSQIHVGNYVPDEDRTYLWPGRQPGGKVDLSYVKVFIDDALLLYFEDVVGDTSSGRGVVQPVLGRPNWIRSSTINFKTNGVYPRSALLGDRDVQIGDQVYVRGIDASCHTCELWTYVTGFVADEEPSVVGTCQTDLYNRNTQTANVTVTKTGGPQNCVQVSADASLYDGLTTGDITETYTIRVTQGPIANCQAARIRVTTASGRDNVAELVVPAFGTPLVVGTRGLKITFSTATGDCTAEAAAAGVPANELVVGQVWTVQVTQAFTKVCGTSGGTYTGLADDTYVVEVTKGGKWANKPEILVTTVKGLDYSGPTTVSASGTAIPIGTKGVTITFGPCATGTIGGLCKGDKFYIPVTPATGGAIRTLVLKHDLPPDLQAATDMDLRLYMKRDIQVTEKRLSNPPEVNYIPEPTQLVLKAGITAYEPSWTVNGAPQALPVKGGKVYLEYREWLPTKADGLYFAAATADLDEIPGPLDKDNPLKFGVFKAMQNANGTSVGYVAVANPDNHESWVQALSFLESRDEIYNIVPMTFDRRVAEVVQSHCRAMSGPESGMWRATFFALHGVTEKMLVGQSPPEQQALRPTSLDGNIVLATVTDDPQATGMQYTQLRVPAGNAGFQTFGVRAGDIVRYMYTVDPWGAETYREFVVDRVLSEDTLLLVSGPETPVTVPRRMEVWRPLSKAEIAEELVQQASFGDSRVCAVWPDYVGSAGDLLPGYYLAAALAGLVSGVAPHQPLSNVEVSGFDDLRRSYMYFSTAQLKRLEQGGVWVVTEDRHGTPYTWHAVTTKTSDVKAAEEMFRRNLDSISYLFLRELRPYVGKTNVTPSMLKKLEFELQKLITQLQVQQFTTVLGGQVISGEVVSLQQNPLLLDHVDVVVQLQLPAPMNIVELRLMV